MRLFREPLLHFAVVGAILFAGFALLNRDRAAVVEAEPVRIGAGEVRWLEETFANQWLRSPTGSELSGLVAGLLEEELLAREAEALGLGEQDTVVRRRLAQKLAFLVADTAQLAEPTEAELRQFHIANPARFRAAGRVSFNQIYFNPARRPHAEADAKTALTRISSNYESVVTEDVGDRLLLETEFRDLDEQTVSNMFGPDFAGAVFALEPGAWRGPLKSGYGLHLVRVTSTSPGALLPFEEARVKVVEEWRRQRERETKAAYLAKLREKYGLVLDDSVKALLPQDMGTVP